MKTEGSQRWIILSIGVLLSSTYAINLYQIPPILTTLQNQLGMNYTQAGSLMSAFSVSGLFMALIWGLLITKKGSKLVGGISLTICIIGNIIIIFSTNYSLLLIGRIISGSGGHAFPVLGASMVSRWFRSKEIGFALGVYTMAFPAGTIVCLNTYGILDSLTSWQTPLLVTLSIDLVLMGYFLRYYRPTTSHQQKTQLNMKMMVTIFLTIIPAGLIWMFYQAASSSYSTFAMPYFLGLGYLPYIASVYTSSWMIGSLFVGPIFGRALDRYKTIPHFVIIAGFLDAILLFSLPLVGPYDFVIILFLIAITPIIPLCVYLLISKRVSTENVNLGFSLHVIFANSGRTIGPLITGLILDATNVYPLSFQVMATFMIIPILSGVYLTMTKTKSNPD